MKRNALLVAFHYPPLQISSGIHRTLAFSRYLLGFGWQPTVLTAQERALPAVRKANYDLIPDGVNVVRGFALDAHKHLSFRGKHLGILAYPDRWQSWIIGGLLKGLQEIRRNSPQIIFSTFPIASSHCVGYFLHKLTKLPWVADFRDPMEQPTWPEEPALRKVFGFIERRVFKHASRIILTTPGAKEFYADKYPQWASKLRQISNGFDEDVFTTISLYRDEQHNGVITLLHSGVLSERDRNPAAFFTALSNLKRAGQLNSGQLQVVLRASSEEGVFAQQLAERNIEDLVTLAPSLPYQEALGEILAADGLIIFQGETCDRQIPAKLYEYLYARKPILTLCNPGGDTDNLVRELDLAGRVDIESVQAIEHGLVNLLGDIASESYSYPDDAVIDTFSRKNGARMLANLFDEVIAEESPSNDHQVEA